MTRMAMVVLVLLGCESEERTHLRLDIPASALDAGITSVEVLLDGDEVDDCVDLILWGIQSCGAQCDPEERDAALPASPQRQVLTPDETGHFGLREIDIDRSGALEVLVIVHVQGMESLYGCRGVSRGETVDLALWWPWCSAQACNRIFNPACDAEVMCDGTLTDPLDIRCSSDQGTIEVWEQDDVPCDEPINQVRCRPALVSCEGDASTVVTDGICPTSSEREMCVMSSGTFMSAMDLNCDGAHPLCETTECMDGMPCGVDACVGRVSCGDGVRPVCVFEGDEICNGMDDDCDRMTDENVLETDCNARRPEGAPAADSCTDRCMCGAEATCRDAGSACCEGTCVDLRIDRMHCGECGNACLGDQRCIAGDCAVPDVADAGAGMDASMPECFGVAECNLTHDGAADQCVDGECLCGDGNACRFPEICCGEDGGRACVDPLTSLRHCGRCGNVCRRCDRGRCLD